MKWWKMVGNGREWWRMVDYDGEWCTVVSDQKAFADLRHPVTIGIHISTEISKPSHPRHLKVY